jgi:translin
MPSLKSILREIRKELKQKEKVREGVQKDMRKVASLSKHAILLIHQKRLIDAKAAIGKAKGIISKLYNYSTTYPDIIYTGLFSNALQEFSEANIFLNLVTEGRFVSPQEINVPSIDYVLGLADVIGEYRRMTLDALREGDIECGENCLKIMDEIFIELMGLDEAYMLIPGLRRKCDNARKIIEATRGDITQETRRNILEKYLKRFEGLSKRG